jgi:uncharacterized protein (TIGR02266 family)
VPPLPLVRVRLKYPDVETLVERFSPNVTRGGIFLASREPQAVGTAIRFEVSLLAGTAVLAGEGRVTWVKPFDPATPTKPHGMGVSFSRIDPACRDMFRRLVERRETTAKRAPTPPGGAVVPAAREVPAFSAEVEGIDDNALRRTMDRARSLAAKVEDVESLLTREAEEAPTLQQALADLPRYLERRRASRSNAAGVPSNSDARSDGAEPGADHPNGAASGPPASGDSAPDDGHDA